ncbi:MAG: hypothetical protein ACJAXA_000733 [Candidatus Aldehydirespiratoraceae bacterium]|jgi:hypothetical protein
MPRLAVAALAIIALSGCGVDDPSLVLRSDQPLAATQRVRHADVELVTFLQPEQ